MAYIDFADETDSMVRDIAAATSVPRHDPVPAGAGRLSALEWSVVAIARTDGMASLRSPGRVALALGSVFGSTPKSRLADPKLEALRRVAVQAWHYGPEIPSDAARDLLAAGFTTDQYETLLASISLARTKRKPR